MKKLLFSVLLMSGAAAMAQDTMMDDDRTADREVIPYNQWSIDFGVGVHKPVRPVAGGYFTNTPSFGQADLGVRYMINDKFGLSLEGGYGRFENDDDSNAFETQLYRVSLEGVVNAGNFLGFKEWTNRFGLLVHGGMGVTGLKYQEPLDIEDMDQMLNFTVGVTPQLRLSDRIALFGDLSIFGHVRQDRTFDGTQPQVLRGFDGFLVNASVGASFYLGGNEVHADWYDNSVDTRLDNLEDRVAILETNNADDDQDGVPNYLDRDNTTESGVRVDTKGRALDLNKNGIPDDMESALDARYAMKGATNGTDGNADGMIEKLINDGYVNVYFEFNSTKPTQYSLSSINFLATYMKDNPSASATLTGYADELGSDEYNQDLSERRAKMVNDILVATGVDAGRLSYEGNGEDASVEKSSSPARQLVRRVKFQVNN
ncbi:OmpA family protein [Nonlabens agnitus]|uniref:Cell envelope biogenesis protein OmpA n=1 Tax=Nonlabens agnitus TaxID=870484 RepID=A0A2S9WTX7_9FLAO|nr:OmpA family protein [Nonlabens agnitus]PRP66933.1 cell envelope biogenesis protein OmpA [Nonlabens agnitus]